MGAFGVLLEAGTRVVKKKLHDLKVKSEATPYKILVRKKKRKGARGSEAHEALR